MPTPESAAPRWMKRLFATTTAFYLVVLVCATHYPKPEELLGRNVPSDKTLHFVAYATLAMLASATLAVSGRWMARTAAWLAATLAAFGVVDEVTQPLFSRAADPLDWVYDCIGIGGGLLAVAAIVALVRRGSPRA